METVSTIYAKRIDSYATFGNTAHNNNYATVASFYFHV